MNKQRRAQPPLPSSIEERILGGLVVCIVAFVVYSLIGAAIYLDTEFFGAVEQ